MAANLTQKALVVIAVILLPAGASAQAVQPFTTDGCSLFPDQSLIDNSDWCSCCLAHDLAYWRGGTADERLKADKDLKSCVLAASGNAKLADLMFAGVRAGGGPYYFTPYRWAYGWPFGRMYEPLSAAEETQVSSLRALYISSNSTMACPTNSSSSFSWKAIPTFQSPETAR